VSRHDYIAQVIIIILKIEIQNMQSELLKSDTLSDKQFW